MPAFAASNAATSAVICAVVQTMHIGPAGGATQVDIWLAGTKAGCDHEVAGVCVERACAIEPFSTARLILTRSW